jgi:hypothetical protein
MARLLTPLPLSLRTPITYLRRFLAYPRPPPMPRIVHQPLIAPLALVNFNPLRFADFVGLGLDGRSVVVGVVGVGGLVKRWGDVVDFLFGGVISLGWVLLGHG